jgi:hypothetical protein
MKKNRISDIVTPQVKFSVLESNEVDGEHILAKIKGTFFVPDGKSRNGRFYPKSLWEKVIASPMTQSLIESRTMYGTIGHDAKLDDKGLRDGLASHIMTNIKINEDGTGEGEAIIIDTPAGRVLNTYLRAGSKLFVSSRADGTFNGKTNDGLAIVDENTYDLKGWDFVIDPGFLQANPRLAEALDEALSEVETNIYNKEGKMNEQLIKHITDENSSLKQSLGKLTDEVKQLEEDKKQIVEENDHVKKELDKLVDANKQLAEYAKLGTVKELTEKLQKADEDKKIIEQYLEFSDSPEHAKTALLKAKEYVDSIQEEFGTREKIREALTVASEFKDEFDTLGGTVSQIKTVIESFTKIVEEKEKEQAAAVEKEKDAEAQKLADETGMEKEEVKEMLQTIGADKIRKMHTRIKESADMSAFKKKPEDEQKPTNESTNTFLGKSSIQRLNESFAKINKVD